MHLAPKIEHSINEVELQPIAKVEESTKSNLGPPPMILVGLFTSKSTKACLVLSGCL